MGAVRHVLVVEDEPEIRTLIRKYLEKLGFSVREAGTGKAALVLLEQMDPILVCLDLNLPEASGREIYEHMRRTERLKGVPLLIITASSMPADRAWAESAGAYLLKPIRWVSFAATVRSLVSVPL